MGITHSWYRPQIIDTENMVQIKNSFETAITILPIESSITQYKTNDFPAEEYDILFSGLFGTCEPFILRKVSLSRTLTAERVREAWQIDKIFEYCKTDSLPYNLPVQITLLVLKNILTDTVKIFSDENDDKWNSAKRICTKMLGYGNNMCIQNNELVILNKI